MADSKPKSSGPKSKTPKVFDVAHPSTRTAAATSKPVIVGHTNMIKQDPMVAPIESAESDIMTSEPSLKKPKRELTIQPVAEPEAASEIQESFDTTEETDEVVAEETILEATQQPDQEDESANEEQTDPVEEDSENIDEVGDDDKAEGEAAVEAIVAGVNTKKDRKDQEEKELKRRQEIEGLINSKKYYVKTHLPPGKRNFRLLVTLIIIVLLAAAGWYFAVGPGKQYWSKEPVIETIAPAATTPPAKADQSKPSEPTTAEYKNTELGISFSYPKDWKVEAAIDTEFATRNVITISAPASTIKAAVSGSQPVDAEVFLRGKIVIENTTNPAEYASDLTALTSCSSEDIIVASTPLKWLFHDSAQPNPAVSQVSLASSNCTPAAAGSTANDQIQFSSKKNTYVVYGEYVYTTAYLQKNGSTSPEAIATAQGAGVITTKEAFVADTNYEQFKSLVKSIKEL